MALFVIRRTKGSSWDHRVGLREQALWGAHAAFMDNLYHNGIVILGGPIVGSDDVMLVVEAADHQEARQIFQSDPWGSDMLVLKTVDEWNLLLGDPHTARNSPRGP